MKQLAKISRFPPLVTKNGFSSNERFEMVIGGGHPDERSNQEWIKIMKTRGHVNIDKGAYKKH